MASFSRYKSEGLIKEISTNVALTCLLSLCDRSWQFGAILFSISSIEDPSLKEREGSKRSPVDRPSRPRNRAKKYSQNSSIRLKLGQRHVRRFYRISS